jgi:hypothetical protein
MSYFKIYKDAEEEILRLKAEIAELRAGIALIADELEKMANSMEREK